MTRDETKQILMVVQAAYPNFDPPDKTVTVDTWHRFLGDYTYAHVDAAVSTYIRSDTSGFAPDIGKVIEKLQTLFRENSINEMVAWGMVLRAIRNSGYHAEEEFSRLPLTIQKAVGSPGQLRDWALSEDVDGTWMNVTQSNFMRTYRVEVAREKELQKLGPEVRQLMGTVYSRLETNLSGNNHGEQENLEERTQNTADEADFSPQVRSMLDGLRDRLKK